MHCHFDQGIAVLFCTTIFRAFLLNVLRIYFYQFHLIKHKTIIIHIMYIVTLFSFKIRPQINLNIQWKNDNNKPNKILHRLCLNVLSNCCLKKLSVISISEIDNRYLWCMYLYIREMRFCIKNITTVVKRFFF